MDAVFAKLIEQGVTFTILAAVLFGLYRGIGTAWVTFKVWGQTLLDHWIASADRRDVVLSTRASDERVGRVLDVLAEHELIDQQRHAELREHVTELAAKNRHDFRDLIQPLYLRRDDDDPTPHT